MNADAKGGPWYFLDSGCSSGLFNMTVDELLARQLLAGEGRPTLRLYGWDPPAISLGYHQRATDVDRMKCMEQGIDVVRRPTGGRAILHSEELTYSVVMSGEKRSIATVYREISLALVAGLRRLGAEVEFASSGADLVRLYRGPSAIPCFSSSSKYEIQFSGKKVVGSAQRRYVSQDGVEVVLQHGSILLGPGHKRLLEFMVRGDEQFQEELKENFEAKTTDLGEILRRRVSYEETAAAVKAGFAETWGIAFVEYEGDVTMPLQEADVSSFHSIQ